MKEQNKMKTINETPVLRRLGAFVWAALSVNKATAPTMALLAESAAHTIVPNRRRTGASFAFVLLSSVIIICFLFHCFYASDWNEELSPLQTNQIRFCVGVTNREETSSGKSEPQSGTKGPQARKSSFERVPFPRVSTGFRNKAQGCESFRIGGGPTEFANRSRAVNGKPWRLLCRQRERTLLTSGSQERLQKQLGNPSTTASGRRVCPPFR